MKTLVLNLVSIFACKKHFLLTLLFISFLSFFNQSCKDDNAPTAPQKKILTAETLAKLEAAADNIMMEKKVPGMIAYIAVEGEGELNITRGVGNLATNEPMNINNHFRIASVTKTFTTEAVLILADEGKIDLNKTISFYLPEYVIPGSDTITIRMLGNMTSGLIDVLNDSAFNAVYYASHGTIKFTPEQLITPLFNSQLQFTPGTQYNYCNSNTILLGLVIKKVTGKELKDVFAEKIFQPLGLKHTFWPETNFLPTPYHHGYTNFLETSNQDVTYYGNSWGNAAGILISSIADLKIWAKEIAEGNLLSANSKNERYLAGVAGSSYRFGVQSFGVFWGHTGAILGWNTMVCYDKTKKITIITHANSLDDEPAPYALVKFANVLGYY